MNHHFFDENIKLPSWPENKKTHNSKKLIEPPLISQVLLGTYVIPLLAILFFITEGIKTKLIIEEYKNTSLYELAHVCRSMIYVCWSVLAYAIIINFGRSLPIVFVLLARVKT